MLQDSEENNTHLSASHQAPEILRNQAWQSREQVPASQQTGSYKCAAKLMCSQKKKWKLRKDAGKLTMEEIHITTGGVEVCQQKEFSGGPCTECQNDCVKMVPVGWCLQGGFT